MTDRDWNNTSFATGDRLLANEWNKHILYGHAINMSGGNISLGAGSLKTTNALIKEDGGYIKIRNISDTGYYSLFPDDVTLPNNRAFKIENTGGTALDIIKLDGSNQAIFGTNDIGTSYIGASGNIYFNINSIIKGIFNSAGFGVDVINSYSGGGVTIAGLNIKSGCPKPVTLADASAENNTIYYSSDQSKLVYKDLNGSVQDLY